MSLSIAITPGPDYWEEKVVVIPSDEAADWWDPNGEGLCIWAAYQPKGAASLAASYTDLSGNGNTAGVGTAPTWDAVNGWKFAAASSQYLTTTFVPQNDQSQTVLIQFSNVGNTGHIFGQYQAINIGFLIRPDTGSAVAYRNGNGITQAPALLSGNLGIAGNQSYRNGAAEGAAIGAYGGATANTCYIGVINGVGAIYITAYIQAFALYDCTLTGAQVLAVATAMSSL